MVGAGILLLAAFFLWLFLLFFSPAKTTTPGTGSTATSTFGSAGQTTPGQTTTTTAGGTNQPLGVSTSGSQPQIFEISTGPVAGAVFMQSGIPTTTLARYVMADSGHVFDMAVDVPGAVAQSVSNTTIPGIENALWATSGQAPSKAGGEVLLQYLESGVTKTVFVGFPSATSTATTSAVAPIQIHFLPDNIAALALSPDGSSVAYLLLTRGGSTGYLANANGTGSRTLFTLPLAQVALSWPSKNALLAVSKSDAASPGIAFSISAKTGAVSQLLFAQGLSAIADAAFSTIIYQTTTSARQTFAHTIATGKDRALSYQPAPEKCAWSPTASSTLVCAAPVASVPINYLDLWHQGLINTPDALFAYNTQTGASLALASPGSTDGGAVASISKVAISPDGKYLLYLTRGDRSLWGVRL